MNGKLSARRIASNQTGGHGHVGSISTGSSPSISSRRNSLQGGTTSGKTLGPKKALAKSSYELEDA